MYILCVGCCHLYLGMRKPDFAHAKTKSQISCAVTADEKTKSQISCAVTADEKTKSQISCAVTAQLISAFVFATRIVQFLF